MISRRASVLALAFLALACSKSEGDKSAPSPSAVAKTSASAPSSTALATATSSAAAAPAARAQAASYGGTYTLAPAKYYISDSKDFASVKQAKDDPAKFVGEGALSLSVAADGKVTGTVDSGPLAPALVDGSLIGEELRGNIRRKDPADGGLTGVFMATASGDAATGSLSLAESSASIVRDGKLTLKRK